MKNDEQLIRDAKEKIENLWSQQGRKWLKTIIKPYGETHDRMEMYVLEGTPSKGYFIINYGNHKLIGFDHTDKKRFTWEIQGDEQ